MTGTVTWESLLGVLTILGIVMTALNAVVIRYFSYRNQDLARMQEVADAWRKELRACADTWRNELVKVDKEWQNEHEKHKAMIDQIRTDIHDRIDRSERRVREDTIKDMEKMEARIIGSIKDTNLTFMAQIADYRKELRAFAENIVTKARPAR